MSSQCDSIIKFFSDYVKFTKPDEDQLKASQITLYSLLCAVIDKDQKRIAKFGFCNDTLDELAYFEIEPHMLQGAELRDGDIDALNKRISKKAEERLAKKEEERQRLEKELTEERERSAQIEAMRAGDLQRIVELESKRVPMMTVFEMLCTLPPAEDLLQLIGNHAEQQRRAAAACSRSKKKVYPIPRIDGSLVRELHCWLTFVLERDHFYTNPPTTEIRDQLNSFIPRPDLGFDRGFYNERSVHLYFSVLMSKAIEPHFKRHHFIYELYFQKHCPDFVWCQVDQETKMPIFGRLPLEIKQYIEDLNVIDVYASQINEGQPTREASAINQAINYFVDKGLKYGVLTTIHQTWVFKLEEGKKIYVSPCVSSSDFLKTVYWLCHQSIIEKQSAPVRDPDSKQRRRGNEEVIWRRTILPQDEFDEECSKVVDDNEKDRDYPPPRESKVRKKVTSSYKPEHDKFEEDKRPELDTDEYAASYKIHWEYEIGCGSSGPVHVAVLLPQREIAAFKCVDAYKQYECFEELLSEARILYYAQELGLRCTPKIYMSGYLNGRYANIIEYLAKDEYVVRRSFNELNDQEKRMFRDALIELASNSIRHNDIEPRHVFFARDGSRCVIIDYGYGEIDKQSTTLELEYWFDEEKLQIKKEEESALPCNVTADNVQLATQTEVMDCDIAAAHPLTYPARYNLDSSNSSPSISTDSSVTNSSKTHSPLSPIVPTGNGPRVVQTPNTHEKKPHVTGHALNLSEQEDSPTSTEDKTNSRNHTTIMHSSFNDSVVSSTPTRPAYDKRD